MDIRYLTNEEISKVIKHFFNNNYIEDRDYYLGYSHILGLDRIVEIIGDGDLIFTVFNNDNFGTLQEIFGYIQREMEEIMPEFDCSKEYRENYLIVSFRWKQPSPTA